MSNSPRFLRSNYTDLFGSSMLPVLEEIFRSNLKQHMSRRELLFKIVATDRDIWQSSELHDMPLLQQLSEGQDYSFEAPPQGANKTMSPVKYGLGFSISEEAVDDGKFAFIADAVAKLAKSAKESQEIQAMNIFNNGFSSETTADGVALFSSSHTLPSGGTIRNQLSSAADLSKTSLEQMLIDFETQFVGDSGIIYSIPPKYLVVHPSNKRAAKELIQSELSPTTVLNSTNGITNVNNINSLRDDNLTVVSSPHLTDSDAWFLTAAPEETGLRVISRKPIETKAAGADVGFVSDSILYKCRYREKIGAIHAYGVFGTPGA
jgi:hypothetical protein